MTRVNITSEKAINNHFDEVSKHASLSMNPAEAKKEYERQRQECLKVFAERGELKVEVVGQQWKIVRENRIFNIRKRTGLSQAKFCEKYEIPKRTLENWEQGSRECPEYLIKLLDRVVKEDF